MQLTRERMTRREFLGAGLGGAAGLAGCVGPGGQVDTDATPTTTEGDATPTPTDGGATPPTDAATPTETPTDGGITRTTTTASEIETVGLETVAEGFISPVAFADPPGEHQYVADQAGRIHVLGEDEPFLDLADRMVDVGGYDERGLLGLAFHPDYPDTPRVYVRYSAPRREGTPGEYSHTFVLAAFEVDSDGLRARKDSERAILEVPQPQGNHNAGAIVFGPEGYLYVGVGDGGGANDTGTGHVADWYDANRGGNGQDVEENVLGSVLRIDVDRAERVRGEERPYGIPEDNPLVDEPGLDEHYAWGFRNPWGMSFAGEDLLVADVGQNRYEEINVVAKGGNYGWNVREGRECFGAEECPDTDPDGRPLRDPVVAYPHSGPDPSGIAVVGGHVYRGDAVPGLRGRYVFGDWRAGGSLFVASPGEGESWPVDVINAEPASKLSNLLAFGQDRSGEVYALTSQRGGVSGETGALHRLVAA
jgi:glucose/arabinose dehydrogenase